MKDIVGKRILFAVCSAVLVFSLGSLGAEPASDASSPEGIPIIVAARDGEIDTVRDLIEKGTDVNAVTEDAWTALMLAAQNGHTDTVKVLLDAGADVNAANKDGWTPLMVATPRGDAKLTKELLDAGADVNATMKNGGTALIVAAVHGHTDIAKMFLDAGANVNAVNAGLTTLDIAIQLGRTDIVKLLLDAGADTDSTPEEALKAAQKAHDNRVIKNQQERFVLETSGVSVPKQIGSLKMTDATDLNRDGSDVVPRFEDPDNWLKISLYVYKSPPSTKGPFLMLDADGNRVLEDREEIIQKYNGVYKLTTPSKSYEDEYSSMVKKISLLGLTLENESRNMAVPTRDDSPIAYVAYLTETKNIDGNDIRFVWEAYLYSIPGYFVKIYCTYPEPLWQEATMTELNFIRSINWNEILPDTEGADKDR
jgi:hypothetical protein